MAHFSKLYILIRQAEIPTNSPQLQRWREPPLSLEPVYSIFLICKHLLSIPAYPWWVPRPLPIIPAFSHCCASILFHLQHTHPFALPPCASSFSAEVQSEFLWAKSGCLDWAVCQSGPPNPWYSYRWNFPLKLFNTPILCSFPKTEHILFLWNMINTGLRN